MRQNHPMHWSYLLGSIIVALLTLGAAYSQDTWALYTSQTVSGKNSLKGGSIELSLSLDSTLDFSISAGSEHTIEMVVKNEGRNALGYRTRFITTGDTDLCEALRLTARVDGTDVYDGKLIDFSYATVAPLARHETDTWQFTASLPAETILGDESVVCETKLDLEAWQNRFLALGMGWYDGIISKVISFTFVPVESLAPAVEKIPVPEPVPDTSGIAEELSSPETITPPVPVVDAPADEVPSETETPTVTEETGTLE